MLNTNKQKPKPLASQTNTVLHDWDRESEWNAIEKLSEAEDVHTLGELFALHRVIRKFKERKGVREDKADTQPIHPDAH